MPEEPTEEIQEAPPSSSSVDTESEVAVAGLPGAIPTAGSFHFMQESELETPSFEDGAEWVERSDAAGHQEPPVTNGHAHQDEHVAPSAPTGVVVFFFLTPYITWANVNF